MRYREKLSIIIMRDNGPRRSFHLRRSNFILLLVFFACLPFLTLLMTIQCWILWEENVTLRDSIERVEADYQTVEARAERLENLETLLEEKNTPGRQIIIPQLAMDAESAMSLPEKPVSEAGNPGEDGPGHDEFPGIDNGRVKVSNVQARIIRSNTLRIGLDLRNPDNEPLLSGEIGAILVTANGRKMPLSFSPKEVSTFRISRFKRTVMNSQVQGNADLINSQVIIEVKEQDGHTIYRNIFPVQQ